MPSILFPTVRASCLIAALASAGLWVRTHFTVDQYTWPVRNGNSGFESVVSRTVQTSPGQLFFQERTALM